MMKKLLCLVLLFLMAFSLTSCFSERVINPDHEYKYFVEIREKMRITNQASNYSHYVIFVYGWEINDDNQSISRSDGFVVDYFEFTNRDSKPHDKYNGSHFQNILTVGQWYIIETYGERNPKKSQYENVVAFSGPYPPPILAEEHTTIVY